MRLGVYFTLLLCFTVKIKCVRINLNGLVKAIFTDVNTNFAFKDVTQPYQVQTTRYDPESDEETETENVPNLSYEDVQKLSKFLYLQSARTLKKIDSDIGDDLENIIQRKLGDKYKEVLRNNKNTKYISRILKGNKPKYLYKLIESVNEVLKETVNNYMSDDSEKENMFHSINSLRKYHYKYLCRRHSICRSKTDFTDICKKVLSVLINMKPSKLSKFYYIFTEQLYKLNIDNLMNESQRVRVLYELILRNMDDGLTLHRDMEHLSDILTGKAKESISATIYRLYKRIIHLLDEASQLDTTKINHLQSLIGKLERWAAKEEINLPVTVKDFLNTVAESTKQWKKEHLDEFNNLVTMIMGETSGESPEETTTAKY